MSSRSAIAAVVLDDRHDQLVQGAIVTRDRGGEPSTPSAVRA
jgi:hypothetical protein